MLRLLACYYRHRADPSTGQAPRGRRWHQRLARLARRLRLKDTALVRLADLQVELDLLDARCTWVMDELLKPSTEAKVLRDLLRPGDTFLDVGANHGSFALTAAGRVGRAGRVLAFEPQPRLASLVRRSFEANRYAHGTVYPCACGDCQREADFFVPDVFSGVGTLHEGFCRGAPRRRETVSVRRLDDLLAGEALPGRVAMKIDVEGSEMAALRGAAAFVRDRRPLVLASAKAAGYEVGELLGFLRDLGYRRAAEPGEFPGTVNIDAADTTRQRNLFILPESSNEPGRWKW